MREPTPTAVRDSFENEVRRRARPDPAWRDQALWSPLTGAFNGPRLRKAIVSRGWTAQEFGTVAGLTAASIYSAMRGHRVRDRTALKIFRALGNREPMALPE